MSKDLSYGLAVIAFIVLFLIMLIGALLISESSNGYDEQQVPNYSSPTEGLTR